MNSGVGQVCPKCNDGIVIELPSVNRGMCHSCCSMFEWKLKEGQKSVTLDNYIEGMSNYGAALPEKEEDKHG